MANETAYEEFMGNWHVGANRVSRSRVSLNGVIETSRDRNRDGRVDMWTAQVARDGEGHFVYRGEDTDADGKADTGEVEFGGDYFVSYRMLKGTDGRKVAGSELQITVARIGLRHVYVDYDGDSTFDRLTTYDRDGLRREYVPDDQQWKLQGERAESGN